MKLGPSVAVPMIDQTPRFLSQEGSQATDLTNMLRTCGQSPCWLAWKNRSIE